MNPLSLAADPINLTEHLLAVEINTEDKKEVALFLEDPEGGLYANKEDLGKWGFHPSETPPITHNDQQYYRLKDYKDLKYDLNQKKMSVHITSPSSHFKLKEMDASQKGLIIPTESSPGAYFNYDTLAQQSKQSRQLSGLFTAGLFNKYGTGFTDFIAQNNKTFQNTGSSTSISSNQFVRLNSSWQIDNPSEMESFVIGDSYTTPGMWGRSVGFGGIQWGTNFGTQPSFVTFPLPSASGDAVVPSVVDLFVNEARVGGRQEASTGPFSIKSIPVTTGAGAINLVTTDLLGRQQQISVPYYVSSTLLKEGLQNYSYSAGFVRQNFGISSNDYKKFVFAGNHQIGVTDYFTAEAHVEVLRKQQTAGIGGNILLGNFGVLNLAGAVSRGNRKTGGLFSVGFQRQAINDISFGTNIQVTSKPFVQLGNIQGTAPRSLWTSFVGIPIFKEGSLGLSYVSQKNRGSPDAKFVTASYGRSLGYGISMSVSAISNIGGIRNKSIFLTLSYNLSEDTNLNVGGTLQKDGNQATVQVNKGLPSGPGYGYNLYAAQGQQKNYQASLTGQTETGTYTAAVANQSGLTAGQLQARGALTYLGENIHFTRSLGQSFAVVQVPGYGNVGVYYQNQLQGHTDADGTLLVPNLLPYQKNPLRVETKDLPLDAHIKNHEIHVVPYYRSGLLVSFPIKSSNSALMNLLLPSGDPVPTGTIVTYKNEKFPVGFEGEVYITGLEENSHLSLDYKKKKHGCKVSHKKSKDPLPHLGKIQCQEQ